MNEKMYQKIKSYIRLLLREAAKQALKTDNRIEGVTFLIEAARAYERVAATEVSEEDFEEAKQTWLRVKAREVSQP